MARLWLNFFRFLKEILLFGVDAFIVSASREIARRFWVRLSGRGGVIGELDAPKKREENSIYVASGGQSRMPFLDEYRD